MSAEIIHEEPVMELDRSIPASSSFYEVLNEKISGSKDSIRIYLTVPNHTDHGLEYKKKLLGSYSTYDEGISQNENEAIRADNIKKALLTTSLATGSAAAISLAAHPTFSDENSNNNRDLIPFAEGGIALLLALAAIKFKNSRTNAKNRRVALEGASKSGEKRFLSRFNPKL